MTGKGVILIELYKMWSPVQLGDREKNTLWKIEAGKVFSLSLTGHWSYIMWYCSGSVLCWLWLCASSLV